MPNGMIASGTQSKNKSHSSRKKLPIVCSCLEISIKNIRKISKYSPLSKMMSFLENSSMLKWLDLSALINSIYPKNHLHLKMLRKSSLMKKYKEGSWYKYLKLLTKKRRREARKEVRELKMMNWWKNKSSSKTSKKISS